MDVGDASSDVEGEGEQQAQGRGGGGRSPPRSSRGCGCTATTSCPSTATTTRCSRPSATRPDGPWRRTALPYRKGCKPSEHMDVTGGSISPSPCTSYQPSPCASYNPSPASSSLPSPASSSYVTNANNPNNSSGFHSLIPWLKNLSSASSSASSSRALNNHHLYIHGGSISAPVTPPLGSPTAQSPRIRADWDDSTVPPSWAGTHCGLLPSSTPPSPGRQVIPEPQWFARLGIPTGGPLSPTFSLVSSNPFGFLKEAVAGGGSSRMCTPRQSGTRSPAIPGGPDIPISDGVSDEFEFGSSSNGNPPVTGPVKAVKAWEGERIHEECASDDLELTLGTARTRLDV